MRFTPAQQIGRQIAKLKKEGYSEENVCIQTLRIELKAITDKYLESTRKTMKYPVHLFAGKKTTHSKTDLTEVFDLIKYQDTRNINSQYEYILKNAPEYLKKFSKGLFKYTPCGVFYTSSERIDIQKLNGIVMLKTNGGQFTENDKKRISSCSHTFAFYQQIIKGQYIILVKASGLTNRNYVDFQQYAEKYYQSLIGCVKLYAPAINDQVFLAHDAKFHYQSGALPLKLI